MAQGANPTADRAGPSLPTKVIYVMGAGRSGSTILGVTLGNCDGVFYAGELDKWLLRAGVSPLEGEERARFWSEVLARVDAADLFGSSARCLERSSALLQPRRLRARRRLRGRYRAIAEELLRSVAAVSHASAVLDSSHYPLRAHELQHVAGIELHLLFLVRDPQAVVASFGREDVPERSYGVLAANAYLWLTHVVCTWVFLRQPRAQRMLIRHEDFLADPLAICRAILAQVGVSGSLPDLSELHTGPVFQANRLVRSSVVALRREQPSKPTRSLLTAVLQAPWRIAVRQLGPRARAPLPAARGAGAQGPPSASGAHPT